VISKTWLCPIVFIVFFTQIGPASAFTTKGNFPAVATSFSKCKDKELWKTRKSNSEICTRQTGKAYWEPALSNDDVYKVSDFCSRMIDTAQCEWTERAGLALVRGKGARDSCVKLLRAVVYAIAKANKENLDANKLGGRAITDNKQFCYDEEVFPK